MPSELAGKRQPSRRMALTEQRVASLRPADRSIYVNDERTLGLSVRVTPTGAKSYVYTKKINGRPVRITLGKVAGLRLEDARRAVEARNGDLAKGVDVGAIHRARRAAEASAITLDDAFMRYLNGKKHKPTTTQDYKALWRLHVPGRLRQRRLGEVTARDIEQLRDRLGVKHQRTANKVVGLIGAIMSKSGRWADNPARGVDRYEEVVRTRRLSMDELERLWLALDAGDDLWSDFFKLLIVTGARRAALCAMRWQDIDLRARVWTVPATWSKNRRELAVPLTDKAVEVLATREARRPNSPWVWPSEVSSTGHLVNPEKPWRRYLKSAHITPHATLHDVRRTLGSRLANSGAASATITKALGHLSPQSARAYVHLDTDTVRDAVESIYGGLGDAT